MRNRVALLLLFTLFFFDLFSQDVQVIYSDTWQAGNPGTVKIRADLGENCRFARIIQEFPLGLNVKAASTPGCEVTFNRQQLVVVWMNPGSRNVSYDYELIPESHVEGDLSVSGRLDIVTGRDSRLTVQCPPLNIKVARGANTVQVRTQTVSEKPVGTNETGSTIYRVQVTVSSENINREEVLRRLKISTGEPMETVKAGSSYKYQFGSFKSQAEAEKYLSELKGKGVKGAFIVTSR